MATTPDRAPVGEPTISQPTESSARRLVEREIPDRPSAAEMTDQQVDRLLHVLQQ